MRRGKLALALVSVLGTSAPLGAQNDPQVAPRIERVSVTATQDGKPLAATVLQIAVPPAGYSHGSTYEENWEEEIEWTCTKQDTEHAQRNVEVKFWAAKGSKGFFLRFSWSDRASSTERDRNCRKLPDSSERAWEVETDVILSPGETARWTGQYGLALEATLLKD